MECSSYVVKRMRSFLTVLGIVIGAGVVFTMVAIGQPLHGFFEFYDTQRNKQDYKPS